jgi:hypothetical protein
VRVSTGFRCEHRRVTTKKDLTANCAAARKVADELYDEMLGDLDAERYGFGWWHGYLDAPRIALISEYLVASVAGVREGLADAEFCFEEWSEMQFADDTWVRQTLQALGSGAAEEQVLRALQRSGQSQKRQTRIRLAAEHVFYHLAQAFDRLSAVTIGVTALNADIVRADWSCIDNDVKFKRAQVAKGGGHPATGPDLQADVRARLLDAVDHAGPQDWFRWVDGKRNTHAHRAPKMQMVITHQKSRRNPSRLVHLFERQPRWSASEELVGNRGQSIEEVWLLREPAAILGGCVASTAIVIRESIEVLTDVWRKRKDDPTILVQPEGQWSKVLSETLLAFDGYGEPVPMPPASGLRVAPETGLRMQASGVFDSSFWKNG